MAFGYGISRFELSGLFGRGVVGVERGVWKDGVFDCVIKKIENQCLCVLFCVILKINLEL